MMAMERMEKFLIRVFRFLHFSDKSDVAAENYIEKLC